MKTAYERLARWRDVGDGSINYMPATKDFGNDVRALLKERDEMLAALCESRPIIADRAAGGRMSTPRSQARKVFCIIRDIIIKATGERP